MTAATAHQRHGTPQPGQPTQVTRTRGVVDDASDHKERPFVKRVCQNTDHGRGVGLFVIEGE